jgi:hypothetical protein
LPSRGEFADVGLGDFAGKENSSKIQAPEKLQTSSSNDRNS